jgi:hypothetical protein
MSRNAVDGETRRLRQEQSFLNVTAIRSDRTFPTSCMRMAWGACGYVYRLTSARGAATHLRMTAGASQMAGPAL